MKPIDCLDLYEDADFYDEEFAKRDLEIPFYLKHAHLAVGPILEVACGTGRITLPIARTGIDVTGLDISPEMLEQARRKAESERLGITWIKQDCRQMELDRTFGLIFSATNAMQHLHDLDSVNAFFASARKGLQPGGTLILDVFNPNPTKLARSVTTRYHHKTIVDSARNEIRVEAASEYHAATQILEIDLFYLRDGALVRTKKVRMRCFYPEELLALCHFNGLQIAQRYGNYDESSFTDDAPKQILLCQRNMKFDSRS